MNQTFSRRRDRLLTYRAMREGKITSSRRTGCPECGEESASLEWERGLWVCPQCGFHRPIDAYYRLANILDPGSFQELEEKLGQQFIRIHRAYLVRTDEIAQVNLKTKEVVLKNKERCPFSRNMKQKLLERMAGQPL